MSPSHSFSFSEAYIPTSMVRHEPMTAQIVFGLVSQPQSNSAFRRPSTSGFSVCLNTCMKCRLQVQTYSRTGRAVIASALDDAKKAVLPMPNAMWFAKSSRIIFTSTILNCVSSFRVPVLQELGSNGLACIMST